MPWHLTQDKHVFISVCSNRQFDQVREPWRARIFPFSRWNQEGLAAHPRSRHQQAEIRTLVS